MNTGTKLRTVLAVAASLHTALMATDLTGFQNEQVDFWYKVISLVLNFVIVAIATYYNNDYTPEALVGTDITRKLKGDGTMVVEVVDGDEEDDDEADPEEDEDGDEVLDPYEGDESGEVEH